MVRREELELELMDMFEIIDADHSGTVDEATPHMMHLSHTGADSAAAGTLAYLLLETRCLMGVGVSRCCPVTIAPNCPSPCR